MCRLITLSATNFLVIDLQTNKELHGTQAIKIQNWFPKIPKKTAYLPDFFRSNEKNVLKAKRFVIF